MNYTLQNAKKWNTWLLVLFSIFGHFFFHFCDYCKMLRSGIVCLFLEFPFSLLVRLSDRQGKECEGNYFSCTYCAFGLQESVSINFLQLSHRKTFPTKCIMQKPQDFDEKSRETYAIMDEFMY